jgi:hypothetical protein
MNIHIVFKDMNVKKRKTREDSIVKTNAVEGGKTTCGRGRCEKGRKGTEQSTYAGGEVRGS